MRLALDAGISIPLLTAVDCFQRDAEVEFQLLRTPPPAVMSIVALTRAAVDVANVNAARGIGMWWHEVNRGRAGTRGSGLSILTLGNNMDGSISPH